MVAFEAKRHTDVLVIGSGIAGCSVALTAANLGLRVLMITRSVEPEESNTRYAQGGIVWEGVEDSPELLVQDILKAGDGLCCLEAVRLLAEEGPPLVKSFLIDELGIKFSTGPDGGFDIALEGGHSCRRILHADDATGRAIECEMIRAAKRHDNISILTNHTAIDLITASHHSVDPLAVYEEPRALGAYFLDGGRRQVVTVLAPHAVLASGGIGQIFLHTTNPEGARGDGLAMAHRAGALIINAEYVQFHPTAFYHADANHFLISESLRGEGARLKTKAGRLFMPDYDSELADLAPRDVVARAIYEEMLRNNDEYVLLDLASYVPDRGQIRRRFPNIYESCLKWGIDISREAIPVVPAAHYFCGGIRVDAWGRTNTRNLYAVGEVACTGLHGANRLASTSLLEGMLWGVRAGRHIAADADRQLPAGVVDIPLWQDQGLEEEVDPALILQDWLTIRTTMWNYVGIVRTAKRLERAEADLRYLSNRIDQFYQRTRLTDALIGLRNGIQVALLVTHAAKRTRRSRGCHFRGD